MQINRFDGGLNIRTDATLIASNEAVSYFNVDNTDMTLKPHKSFTKTPTEARDYFYYFQGAWISAYQNRDYVEYDGKLYYTQAGSVPQKYFNGNSTNLGIAPPPPNNLFEVDGVTPIVDGDGNQVRTIYPTAVDPEGGEVALDADDPLVLQYCYTYYNSVEDIESAPSALSLELTVPATKVVKLVNIVYSPDNQVDKIRIYKVGTNITEFSLVKEIPNNPLSTSTAEARDAVKSTEVGRLLDSLNFQQPLSNLQNLVQAYGILFASVGNKVYYSILGKPNYWPAENFILIESDVTALFPISDGVLIFTIDKMFVLVGTTQEEFSLYPVSTEEGCVSHKSCKLVKNVPVWKSLNGICSWQSGSVEVISLDKLGILDFSVKNAAVHQKTYYLLSTNGNMLAMDLRFGLTFKDFDFVPSITDIGVFDGNLYAIVEEKVSTLFTGDLLRMSYKSPKYTEGSVTVTKLYNNIYVKCEGEIQIKVYIDDVLVLDKELPDQKIVHDIKVPEHKQRGTWIQFEIIGKGKVYEIEYKTVGRNNGR